MAYVNNKVHKVSLQCQKLLYALVLTLVFEGIVRKILPTAFGIALFFVKDLICCIAIYVLFDKKFRGNEGRMHNMWKTLFVAFVPLILYTGTFDINLSVFGPKQYMLFTVTALLVPTAFPIGREQEFKKFCAFLASLLIPTTLVAMLQNALPASHWLNRDVSGGSLEAFAAAGYLRVTSTFSFTGQFGWFLNSVCIFFSIRFFLPPVYKSGFLKLAEKFMPLVLGVLLIVAAFVTGGRTAVLGCGACLLLGLLLSGLKRPQWLFGKGILALVFLAGSLSILSAVKPEFFAAYKARSRGTETETHAQEVQGRLMGNFSSWTEWFDRQEWDAFMLGNGLGVMSNGSDRVSDYAKSIRSNGFWTETDIATTVWEGGLYLVIVWYGFRLAVILFCARTWLSIKSTSYSLASSFLLSYVIITGVLGSLGIQPPIAIWWFLCVGALITIRSYDIHQQMHSSFDP